MASNMTNATYDLLLLARDPRLADRALALVRQVLRRRAPARAPLALPAHNPAQ